MENKLREIFNFLDANREYNHAFQTKCYILDITPYNNVSDKVLSLLYRVVNTQSKPKIDKLAQTFKDFDGDSGCLESFDSFIKHISKDKYKKEGEKNKQKKSNGKFDLLYLGMRDLPGWGPKTAALFVKSIYHLHNGIYGDKDELKIWKDAPIKIEDGDVFRLPVDAVMESIFKIINPLGKKMGFDSVNKKLNEMKYSAEKIEVWDDLWFWGFFTQSSGGDERQFGWNENKYWAQSDTSKNQDTIKNIKEQAEIFLKILK